MSEPEALDRSEENARIVREGPNLLTEGDR